MMNGDKIQVEMGGYCEVGRRYVEIGGYCEVGGRYVEM